MTSQHRAAPLLHHVTSGPTDRPWVTLIPGITNDASFWDEQVAMLEHSWRVLRFDPRGHGTSPIGEIADYGVVSLTQDIVQLWDHLAIQQSHVVAFGFGGSLAIGMALTMPERVRSLVGCCCRATITPDFIKLWTDRAETVAEHGIAAILDDTVRRWFTPTFTAARPAVIANVRAMVQRTSVAGYVGHAHAFTTIDLQQQLPCLAAPILFVSAADDPGGGRPEVMQQMATMVRGSRHVSVPGGHLCNIESPAEFNTAISSFLAEHEWSSGTEC
jgi:3-oxoadipate enol-lactonase